MIANPPKRLTELITKKNAYEERNLENCISDSYIYLDRHCRLSRRDELHVLTHQIKKVPVGFTYRHFCCI